MSFFANFFYFSTIIELPSHGRGLITASTDSLDGNLESLLKSYRTHYLRENAFVELFDYDSTKLSKLSMARILKWLHQVASALAYMSERQIIHTDVREGCHLICIQIVHSSLIKNDHEDSYWMVTFLKSL